MKTAVVGVPQVLCVLSFLVVSDGAPTPPTGGSLSSSSVGNVAITEALLDEFKKGFEVFDKNNDGKITKDEFISVMRTVEKQRTEEELQGMFELADEDENGTIDFNEFLQMLAKSMDGDFRQAFDIADRDKNGLISRNELSVLMKSIGQKLTDEEIDEMIRKGDTDGDGSLNYIEFVKCVTKK